MHAGLCVCLRCFVLGCLDLICLGSSCYVLRDLSWIACLSDSVIAGLLFE